jgi:hypothetical protein
VQPFLQLLVSTHPNAARHQYGKFGSQFGGMQGRTSPSCWHQHQHLPAAARLPNGHLSQQNATGSSRVCDRGHWGQMAATVRGKCTAVAQGSYVFAMFTFAPAATSNFATSKRPFSAEKLMGKLPFPFLKKHSKSQGRKQRRRVRSRSSPAVPHGRCCCHRRCCCSFGI